MSHGSTLFKALVIVSCIGLNPAWAAGNHQPVGCMDSISTFFAKVTAPFKSCLSTVKEEIEELEEGGSLDNISIHTPHINLSGGKIDVDVSDLPLTSRFLGFLGYK